MLIPSSVAKETVIASGFSTAASSRAASKALSFAVYVFPLVAFATMSCAPGAAPVKAVSLAVARAATCVPCSDAHPPSLPGITFASPSP